MKKTLTLFTLLLMAMVYGQVPKISYASPQYYPVGTTITPLTPTNTGGAVVGSANVSTLAGKTQGQDGSGSDAVFNGPSGVAVDALGNIYMADTYNHKIRKITPLGVVTTLAGSGAIGDSDGMGTSANFYAPEGIAVDAAGNCYIADMINNKIRKITPEGVVTTLAGNGASGATDGTGTAASFNRPSGVAIDVNSNLYVADTNNHKIRKITPEGVVTTLAGNGASGATDGTGTTASFNLPSGVTIDANSNLYVADTNNHKIRKITPIGVVSTLAGNGASGATDGTGTTASFNLPSGVAVDVNSNLYVADTNNHKIRKITPTGVVTTLAGNGASGSKDGTGTTASFNKPKGIVFNATGNLFIADYLNCKIRKITPTGAVTSLAGSCFYGDVDSIGTMSSFNEPNGIAVDEMGNVYVADTNNHKIRKITPIGVVSTLAGSGKVGAIDGSGTIARFNNPKGVTIDVNGNLYVADTNNHKIRKITPTGEVSTLAGSGSVGSNNGIGMAASFNFPSGVAVDNWGYVYIADDNNHKIRKITSEGVVSTLAGSGTPGAIDGSVTTARFKIPSGVAVDTLGNVFVADSGNNKIRRLDGGTASTLAGNDTPGANDGTGAAASFFRPTDVAVDASGQVYVVDKDNNKIRIIRIWALVNGVVTTLAGSGTPGAIDGSGTTARFNGPSGVAIDALGNVFVADTNNHKIRKITVMGGYQITPTLPAGLSFDETTGVISGTPTVASPLTYYNVTATNSAGSTTTKIAIITAVLDNPSFTKESLSLFPNPAHNLLQIQTSDNLTIDRVIITDLTGKVIMEQALETNTINIAQLASGMYLIKAFSGQQAFTSKFMKAL